MPNKEYVLTMARYNHWQNQSLIAAADGLTAAERMKERGAFFGSIQKTLSHVFWGDSVWMSKFTGSPAPQGGIPDSTDFITDWDQFRIERKALDERILQWAHDVAPDWFDGDLSWYSMVQDREVSKPKSTLVIHLFNHQTHHRGQVHAMLTSAGATPDDTDVPFMPERFQDL
jgi:uncharacterized damage-inducible protein DinB